MALAVTHVGAIFPHRHVTTFLNPNAWFAAVIGTAVAARTADEGNRTPTLRRAAAAMA